MRYYCKYVKRYESQAISPQPNSDGVLKQFDNCIQHDSVWISFNNRYGIDYHDNGQYAILVDGHFIISRTFEERNISLPPESDTPNFKRAYILSELYRQLGDEIWQYLEGSFAAFIYDKENCNLKCATDRFGSKRIYYHQNQGKPQLTFSDSINALLPGLDSIELDLKALTEHIYYRWLVGNRHLVSGIRMMESSEYITADNHLSVVRNRYAEIRFKYEELYSSLDGWADATAEAFDELFTRLSKHYKHPAVLLSGGVDSSIIAAYTNKYFKNCIAVSPVWKTGATPELQMATNFAKHLGMHHHLVEVTDDDLVAWCSSLHEKLEQTPRHFSSMPLGVMLNSLPPETDMVLHGEAGDSYFGCGGAKKYAEFAERAQRWQKLPGWLLGIINSVLPKHSQSNRIIAYIIRHYSKISFSEADNFLGEFRKALFTNSDNIVYQFKKIVTETPMEIPFPCFNENYFPTNRYLAAAISQEGDWRAKLQTLEIQGGNTNNVFTVDRLCPDKSFDLVFPYLSSSLRAVGEKLPLRWHSVNGVVKPVLKHLGSRFFPDEWMHFPKHGFATPTADWLGNQLSGYMELIDEEKTRQRGLVNVDFFKKLRLEREYDIIWTALQMELFMRTFVDEKVDKDGKD